MYFTLLLVKPTDNEAYVIWFDFSNFLIKPINNDNHRHKRTSFSVLNRTYTEKNISIKHYFINRYCIKYNGIKQPFRFNEQSGQIDISGKLRIVVSIDALDSLTHRYNGYIYNSFPLYFQISCAVGYILTCITLLSKTLIPILITRLNNVTN
ncbi:unnamed protein product [Rotaria sp. Silwood1]|nr:unnamed protein product [Rotaria sp. Silwood1]CAF3608390.1 unnamed protein product [Rotaria sp. Silwood1]CAF4787156.1 unnamed protein product [Rotaria sp. Silwood1]